MRKEFITANSRKAAQKLAPWAATIARVEGGYIAFESHGDYLVWRAQK